MQSFDLITFTKFREIVSLFTHPSDRQVTSSPVWAYFMLHTSELNSKKFNNIFALIPIFTLQENKIIIFDNCKKETYAKAVYHQTIVPAYL